MSKRRSVTRQQFMTSGTASLDRRIQRHWAGTNDDYSGKSYIVIIMHNVITNGIILFAAIILVGFFPLHTWRNACLNTYLNINSPSEFDLCLACIAISCVYVDSLLQRSD